MTGRQFMTAMRRRFREMVFHIYGLADPRDGSIWYVGRSTQPKRRAASHSTPRSEGAYKREWVAELAACGLRPAMVMLETVAGVPAAIVAEARWVAYGRATGWPLLNVSVPSSAGMTLGLHPNGVTIYTPASIGRAAQKAVARARREAHRLVHADVAA